MLKQIIRKQIFLQQMAIGSLLSVTWGCTESVPSVSSPEVAVSTQITVIPDIPFKDVTEQLGVNFVFDSGARGEKLLPEIMVGGVALADMDNDGDLDLLAVKGHPWNDLSEQRTASLFINQNGHFEEASAQWQLDFTGYGIGINVADYDGDGWRDVFISALGKNALYRNAGGQHFEDVTEQTGVAGAANDFSIAGVFFDTDNDQVPELFVLNYLHWDKDVDTRTVESLVGVPRTYNGPNVFRGATSRLYKWQGERFTEVTRAHGIEVVDPHTSEPIGKSLGVLPVDLNGDGYVDLVVANDRIRNFVFVNDGTGKFSEQGESLGLAYDNSGRSTAAMGLDLAVLDDSGILSIGMGNFSGEMTSLYRQRIRGGNFIDDAAITGVGLHTRSAVTFGLLFEDLDLDGYQELVQTNGHTEPEIHKAQQSQSFRQSPQVLYNCAGNCERQFQLLPESQAGDLYTALAGRGLASGDIDNDGDTDLVFSDIDRSIRIYRNDQTAGNNWLQLEILGPCGNLDGIGAVVDIEANGRSQRRFVSPPRSYASQVSPILNFGLGDAQLVDTVNIRWLGGHTSQLRAVSVNQRVTNRHPDSCTPPTAN